MTSVRLGDLLVRRGVLTEAQRDAVLEYQQTTGRPFGELAERLFGVDESAVEEAWAEQYAGLAQRVDPRSERVEADALRLIDRRQAWQFRLLPLRIEAGELMACTTQVHLVRALRFAGWHIRRPCYFVLSDPLALWEALQRYYPLEGMPPAVVARRHGRAGTP